MADAQDQALLRDQQGGATQAMLDQNGFSPIDISSAYPDGLDPNFAGPGGSYSDAATYAANLQREAEQNARRWGGDAPGIQTPSGTFASEADYLSKARQFQQSGYGSDSGMNPDAAFALWNDAKLPLDPFRIVYNGGGPGSSNNRFTLDSPQGPDIFGGKFPTTAALASIPRSLQPLLGPSLARFYQDAQYQGGAARGQMSAPWTRFYAPPAAQVGNGQFDHTWPGITRYDPWGRSMGEYPNLYS